MYQMCYDLGLQEAYPGLEDRIWKAGEAISSKCL